jgi:predicted secreted acid phosphatase
MKAATQLQQSPEVQKAFESTVARAQKYLDSLKPSADKLVIFDLDDTLIDDIPYYAQPEPRNFSEWLHQRPVKYHESVLKLLKSAKARGFSVVYITGRRSNYTLATAEQVQDLPWDGTYTRPLGLALTSEAYKTAVRKMLKGIGYTTVLNIGDQVTDHDLPIDESKGEFLLPNVMYTVY